MLRYLVIATLIVLGVIFIATLVPRRPATFDVVSPKTTSTPTRRNEAADTTFDRGVRGDAPWALSVLPECFTLHKTYRGTTQFLLGKLPPGVHEISAGTTLAVRDCALHVGGNDIVVDRGEEHLRIPAPAQIYASDTGIALLHVVDGKRTLVIYGASGTISRTDPTS
jgi:hypothetical protein